MNQGSAQGRRFPPGPPKLAARQFGVDETPLHHLVAMTAALAGDLHFVDRDNYPSEGTWAMLFEGDESLQLACIASFDRQLAQSRFVGLWQWAPAPALEHEVVELVCQLDAWYRLLMRPAQPGHTGSAATASLCAVIKQAVGPALKARLAWLRQEYGTAESAQRSIKDRAAGLDPRLWDLPCVPAPVPRAPAREKLRGDFFSLLSTIGLVQTSARDLLPKTLATGRHEPAAGLLLAFLRMYTTVQGRINGFTDRHIDFYYRQCLEFQQRPVQADHVLVVCTAAAHAQLPVVVPAGTVFGAGKAADRRVITFKADDRLLLGDARIAALCMLRLERDLLISPEAELGYVTRAKATRVPMPPPPGASWPLFGGAVGEGLGGADAQLGLLLASPLLQLGEGRREVALTLRLDWPDGSRKRLLREARRASAGKQVAQFRMLFGRLFSLWLLSSQRPEPAVERQDRRLLRRWAQALQLEPEPGDPATRDIGEALYYLWGAEPPDRDLIFDRALRDAFEVHFTGPNGWTRAAHLRLRRAPRAGSRGGGLQVLGHLRPADPPVVGCSAPIHGAQWPTRLPLMRLQLTGRGRLFPYSLFEGAELRKAELAVRVFGVRDVALHNNLGRLDASKGFSPFGPLPTSSSYLVFGAPEIACKGLDALRLNIEWGGLPRDVGGFSSYYAGYGPEQGNAAYRVAFSILSGGQWHPCAGRSADQPLFATLDDNRRLTAQSSLEIDSHSVRSHSRASAAPSEYGLSARDGFFRMQLCAPMGAFGHQIYPQILAAAVTPTRWGGRPAKTLPNPPYTPLIDRLTLDYEAHTSIPVGRDRVVASCDSERLLHLHPFGVAEVLVPAEGPAPGVLPEMEHDGNLYIGLQAAALDGPLTLLFHLLDDASNDLPKTASADNQNAGDDEDLQFGLAVANVGWYSLRGDGWQPLKPSQVLTDSTSDFRFSGIVTLDLSPQLERSSEVLDSGLFWLRVAATQGINTVARLRNVYTHALALTRVTDPAAQDIAVALPERSVTGPLSAIAGLAAVTQVGRSFGLRAAEDQHHMRVRAGERLRHKNRASLAWDTERLVLEHFPEVFKVKCFAPDESGLGAGQVLVVVVPDMRPVKPADHARALRLSAVTIERIRSFLARRASDFATIKVRNTAYEHIQVRCTLSLQRNSQGGRVLQQVNDAILEYLSPWRDRDTGPGFDWVLHCEDMRHRIRQVDGVNGVTGLWLLGVARDDYGFYTLQDSARAEGGSVDSLRASSHWSIALPMRQHLINHVDMPKDLRHEKAGFGVLEVGATVVVGSAP